VDTRTPPREPLKKSLLSCVLDCNPEFLLLPSVAI
jgi:hypothetical protein